MGVARKRTIRRQEISYGQVHLSLGRTSPRLLRSRSEATGAGNSPFGKREVREISKASGIYVVRTMVIQFFEFCRT